MVSLAELTFDIDAIVTSLLRRIHEVMDRHVVGMPEQVALIEDGASWSYRDLDRHVREIADHLTSLQVRPGDRIMIVSENCIALAALLLAASRIDAWAIVSNPRLSARETKIF
jgi:long-chain acyl-CoA synthetase